MRTAESGKFREEGGGRGGGRGGGKRIVGEAVEWG